MQNPRDPNRDREPVEREQRYAPGEEHREPVEREPYAGRPEERRYPEEGRRYPEERRYEEPRYYGGGTRAFALSDLVRWGPILAGFAATMGVLILMGVLGAAIGIGIGEVGTFAAIWGAVSLIIAFFVGGWIAARTSAVGGMMPAIINSSIVWAFTLLFLLFLAGLGVVGVAGVALEALLVPGAVPGAAVAAQTAWWALAGLVLGLAAAIVGGLVGQHPDAETIVR